MSSDPLVMKLIEENKALSLRLHSVTSAFIRYGQHLPECDLETHTKDEKPSCTCGFGQTFIAVEKGRIES